MPRTPLPIDAALPELLARLAEAGAVVLRAPTGAGKTTRVPPAILDAGLANAGQVLLLEPRRVAARAAARRMAVESDTPLGDVFGYHVRFDKKAGPRTRVVAVTPGMLLRRLHDDPFLESIAAIVFDEFHERGLDSDLALGMVRLIRQAVRPDLKVVVMSATVDPGPISTYLGNCPAVASEGRTFPVDIRYRPKRSETPWPVATATAIRDVLDVTDGDVLAFLPGLREIRQTEAELERFAREQGIAVLPLHGDLPPEQQDRALAKLDRRKVVLATNVAETSVTVDGVTAVVDTGLARQMEFDASVGMDRLRLVPISRASADQRAGRAGRTRPGVCVRLWDEPGHRSRAEQTEPEIRRVDLAGAVLSLLALGEADVANFPWLDSPRPEAVRQAFELLRRLDAVSDTGLTDTGKTLAGFPVHPRLGRLLVEGARLGVADRAALAAAVLADRDPLDREQGGPPHATFSDLLDRVEMLEEFEATRNLGRLHRGAAFATLQARDHLERLALTPSPLEGEGRGGGYAPGVEARPLPNPPPQGGRGPAIRSFASAPCLAPDPGAGPTSDANLLRAVFAAFPDRLARRRTPGDRRAKMVGGRGVRLAPSSGVDEAELFVCVDVDAGGVESLVRLASAVRREWLPPDRLATVTEVVFDPDSEKLVARKQLRFDDLVLDETPSHIADEADAARVLAVAAGERLARVLPPTDSPAGQFRTRVRCLRAWVPELELPAMTDDDLAAMLPELCRGMRSLAAIRDGPWMDAFRTAIPYEKWQAVERDAPERLTVPTGSQIALAYEENRPPVLAVRIQELFGLAETPRVGRGRVKVLLHLLAPNYRPQQVTDDLASFWKNGYPVVRKELRARYPRHSWPDDPLTADAIRGPKKRGE